MNVATLTYIVNPHTQEVLMAKKTRKIGIGFWFGYGGKLKWWQTARGNAKDEIWEETGGEPKKRKDPAEEGGIRIRKQDLEFCGVMDFYNGPDVPFGNPSFRVYCYRLQAHEGRAIATDEMVDPSWFSISSVQELDAKGELKPGDILFVPFILRGISIRGYIRFSEKKEVIDSSIDFYDATASTEPRLPRIVYMLTGLFGQKTA